MRKNAFLLAFIVVIFLFMVWAQSGLRAAGHGTLKVTLNYNGMGVVDGQHKAYVVLTNANPFTSTRLLDASQMVTSEARAARVLACEGTPSKDGTITFHRLSATTVYAMAFFDKTGYYNGPLDSPPPGSPMGVYGKIPDKLMPIKVEDGNTSEIVLTFDDSTMTP